MPFIANTRAAVYRGSAPNGLGDEVDNNSAPLAGLSSVRASIIERTRTVLDPASGEPRTIRNVVGRLPGDADVVKGDRVQDVRRGVFYVVEEITYTPYTLSGTRELRLDLRTN